MAALIVVLHAGYVLAPPVEQGDLRWHFALAPQRFWAAAGSEDVYADHASGLITLVSSALLHGDWIHVILNALMLVWFGLPVARALGPGAAAWGYWMLIFVGAIIGGSALYLALTDAGSAYLVGASGGTSGLIAAALLLDRKGGKLRPWSPHFLLPTAIFALINILLVFAAPYTLGMFVSWEAHLGGYVAGMLLMALMPVRGYAWSGT